MINLGLFMADEASAGTTAVRTRSDNCAYEDRKQLIDIHCPSPWTLSQMD